MWLSVVLVRTTFRNSKGKVIPVVDAAEGLRWFFTRAYSHPGRKGLPQMDAGGADRVNRSRSLTRSSFSVFFPNSNPRTRNENDICRQPAGGRSGALVNALAYDRDSITV